MELEILRKELSYYERRRKENSASNKQEHAIKNIAQIKAIQHAIDKIKEERTRRSKK